MSDNLVLEMLRAIRGDIVEIKTEQREQRGRLGSIERTLAHVERELAEHNGRFDRILDRLDRIEQRLELRDA